MITRRQPSTPPTPALQPSRSAAPCQICLQVRNEAPLTIPLSKNRWALSPVFNGCMYVRTFDVAALKRQTSLAERALELLALPGDGTPRLLLDIGCGSCLSGEAITEAGHQWLVSVLGPR